MARSDVLFECPRWLLLVMAVLIQLLCCQINAFAFRCSDGRGSPAKTRSRHFVMARALSAEKEEQSTAEDATTSSSERMVCFITGMEDSRQDVNFTEIATKLARNLDVPVVCPDFSGESCPFTHSLSVIPYHFEDTMSYALAIQELSNNDTKKSRRRRASKKPKSKPFYVDFMPPSNSRLGKRFQGQSGTDMLLKAVSPRSKVVFDLTAGFGQDSLLMAQGGASRMHMVERDPIVAALLSDALRRLRLIASDGDSLDPQIQRARDLSERLTLEQTRDAVEVAKNSSAERPDVCYLDPMFPSRKKAAAVKKNMQILHGLLGSQVIDDIEARQNEDDLLQAAWNLARERVIVKRPINADNLGGNFEQEIKPSYEIKGSVNRWDVYVK